MIISFKDKDAEKIWNGNVSTNLPFEIQHTARRKLRMINNSQNINDLRAISIFQITHQFFQSITERSIRINDQWRIVFCWDGSNSSEIEIIDYH